VIFHSYVSLPEGNGDKSHGSPVVSAHGSPSQGASALKRRLETWKVSDVRSKVSQGVHQWAMGIPSGKQAHNYGKSPFFMGKLTINDHFQ
jgi:hypothetical protein